MKKTFAIIGLLLYLFFSLDYTVEKKLDSKIKTFNYYLKETKDAELTFYTLWFCDIYTVPVSLAFAVCKQESGYCLKKWNINYDKDGNYSSIDRGFYQLNSRTFKNLKWIDFYTAKTNCKYGIEHLSQAINYTNENYRHAIYIYNGGIGNFINNRIKQITLDHAQRILLHKFNFDMQI